MKTPLPLRILATIGLAFCVTACSSFTTTSANSEAALSPNSPGSAFGVDAGPGSASGTGFNNGSNGGGSGVGPTSGH